MYSKSKKQNKDRVQEENKEKKIDDTHTENGVKEAFLHLFLSRLSRSRIKFVKVFIVCLTVFFFLLVSVKNDSV